MSRIKVSQKHGINPSIPICFWCGEEKGEIALLGKLPGDKEAPKNIVLNYDPCDKCKEIFDQGIAFIEGIPSTGDVPEITPGASPTGRFIVIKTEVATKLLENCMPSAAEATLRHKKAIVDPEVFNMLMPKESE